VQKLEEEVNAAKRHVEQAAAELAAKKKEEVQTQKSLTAISSIKSLDEGLTDDVVGLLEDCEEPLALIFEAFSGSLYADDEPKKGDAPPSLDHAEFIYFLQEFGILGRAEPPELMCGVFYGCPAQLDSQSYKRCIARSALALAPDDEDGNKLLWLLMVLTENIHGTKMAALDVQRRVKVINACDILMDIIYEPEPEE